MTEEQVKTSTAPEDESDDQEQEVVEREQAKLRQFVKGLSGDDIKSGNWFSKLLTVALDSYTSKVDYAYFQQLYDGAPADVIVDQRIKMAARYAALEGGLSAGAYTAAVAATIGSAGAASPLTLSAAAVTLLVDLAFTTQLQLRLAYDIAVLYRIPLDTSDPEDLWKLIRVAFTIKSGEVASEGLIKAVPVLIRPLIRRFYSRSVLSAARGLPVVGKFLLQRNVIKVGIPLVGVTLAAALNRYTTLIAGRYARDVFREEARIIESARRLCERSKNPQTLLWVAWLVIKADGIISDPEALLIRHLVKFVRAHYLVVDDELAHLVDLDPQDVWDRIKSEPDDCTDLVEAAQKVAAIDSKINSREQAVLDELRYRCERG